MSVIDEAQTQQELEEIVQKDLEWIPAIIEALE